MSLKEALQDQASEAGTVTVEEARELEEERVEQTFILTSSLNQPLEKLLGTLAAKEVLIQCRCPAKCFMEDVSRSDGFDDLSSGNKLNLFGRRTCRCFRMHKGADAQAASAEKAWMTCQSHSVSHRHTRFSHLRMYIRGPGIFTH